MLPLLALTVHVVATPPRPTASLELLCAGQAVREIQVTPGEPVTLAPPCLPVEVQARAPGYLPAEARGDSADATLTLALVQPVRLRFPAEGPRVVRVGWLVEGRELEAHAPEPGANTAELVPGTGCLVVVRDGHVPASGLLELQPGSEVALSPELPEKATTLEGTVVDPAGLPVAGASIELVTPTSDTGGDAEKLCARALAALGFVSTSSDRGGMFSLPGQAPGRRTLRVRHEGHARWEQDLVIGTGGGIVRRTITLQPAGALTVEVDASASGESPPFEVLLEREVFTTLYASDRWQEIAKVTIADGPEPSWDSLVPGTYRVTLRKEGSDLSTWTEVAIPAGTSERVILRPVPVVVHGTVRSGRRAIEGATITLYRQDRQVGQAESDQRGDYELRVWKPASYAMTVEAPGKASFLPVVVDLASTRPGERVRKDLDLPSHGLRGVVLDRESSQPVSDATVVVDEELPKEQMASQRSLQSGPDGAFELPFVRREARLTLSVRAPGYQAFSTAWSPETLPDEPVRVLLERGELLRGRVLGPGGEPVAGARVASYAAPFERMASSVTRTAGDGSFEISLKPGGLVWVTARGYAIGSAAATGADAVVRLLPAGEKLRLRLSGRESPAAGVALTLVRIDGTVFPLSILADHAALHGGRAVADRDGWVSLTGVPPGTYQLLAVRDGATVALPVIQVPDADGSVLQVPGL